MTLTEACNVLHIEQGANDELVTALINAIPGYIEITTGMDADKQAAEPLCNTVSNFIITLWYYADHADDIALNRTISNLLACIKAKAATNEV